MSTRGCIARPAADGGWEGRYHHFDSYPTGLGATLFDLYHGHFDQNLRSMQAYLIDQHPAGWSTINNCDFDLAPGFDDYPRARGKQPVCYCHRDRHAEEYLIKCRGSDRHGDHCDGSDCDPLFIEWAYVLGPEGMAVYCFERTVSEKDADAIFAKTGSYNSAYHHHLLTSIAWSDTPDWDAIEAMKYGEEN